MNTYGYRIKLVDGLYTLAYRDMPVIYRTRWYWLVKLLLCYRLFKVEWFMFGAYYRINGYWRRKRFRQLKNYLHRPICWFKGHNSYSDGSWGYSSTRCSRCQKQLTYKSYRTK